MKVASWSGVFPRHGQPFPIVPLQHLGFPFRHPQTPPCRWQHPAWARSKGPSLPEQGKAPDVASDAGGGTSSGDAATTGYGSAVGRARTPVITIASTERFMISPSLPGVALRHRSRSAPEQPGCHALESRLVRYSGTSESVPPRKSGIRLSAIGRISCCPASPYSDSTKPSACRTELETSRRCSDGPRAPPSPRRSRATRPG
jgi:hypothetical protein